MNVHCVIEICFNRLLLLHVCALEPVSLLVWSLEDTYIIQTRVVPPSCSITSACCTKKKKLPRRYVRGVLFASFHLSIQWEKIFK